VHLTANQASGWTYLQLPDPSGGNLRLKSVTRSDGTPVLLDDDAWTTDRTFRSGETFARREHLFHLLDYNGTGSYPLVFEKLDTTSPTITSVTPVSPSTRSVPVDSITVTLSKPIDPNTLAAALTLTMNGGTNLITPGSVQATLVAGTTATYLVSGL